MIFFRIVAAILGVLVTCGALRSAVRTLLTPRSIRDPISSFVFINTRRFFELRMRRLKTYAQKDHWMAYYAPTGLLALLLVYLLLVLLGFMFLFWASGIQSWTEAFTISGSSLNSKRMRKHNAT